MSYKGLAMFFLILAYTPHTRKKYQLTSIPVSKKNKFKKVISPEMPGLRLLSKAVEGLGTIW